MKGKRSKTYRKLMQKYELNFDFRVPYQVLVDAEIIKDAARFKMQLGKMLQDTLHGEIKPMITQCCIRHLYNAPSDPHKDEWIEAAKQAERRRCGHHELPEPLSALECLESVVDPKGSGTNKHRYVVASQDRSVRRKMRTIVGVPLIYVARSVMVLEPMADVTQGVREREEKAKVKAGLGGRRIVGAEVGEKRKRADGDSDSDADERAQLGPKKQKKKGPKGPNPLAVKKSKKDKSTQHQADEEKAVLRKATRNDHQIAAGSAGSEVSVNGHAEAPTKRKRKRKPKDAAGDGVVALSTADYSGEDD